MLGKLYKYELKAGLRIFPPILGALLIFTLLQKFMNSDPVNRFFYTQSNWIYSVIQFLITMMYGVLVGGVMILTVVVLTQRFSKSLLGDEGYLMLTLPVKPWQHLTARLLSAATWITISGAAAVLSVCLLAWNRVSEVERFFREFGLILEESALVLEVPPAVVFLELVLFYLVWMVGGILPMFAAICAGQLVGRMKGLLSIVSYMAFFVLTSMLFGRFMQAVEHTWYDKLHVHAIFWLIIAFYAIIHGLCFAAANYILSRRLNLE